MTVTLANRGVRDWQALDPAELRAQADLLRHIVSNPFRPPPAVPFLPSFVRDLAEAVYQQYPAAVGPLHDALLDLGQPELAAHFSDPAAWHPKGCWAADYLTGRT